MTAPSRAGPPRAEREAAQAVNEFRSEIAAIVARPASTRARATLHVLTAMVLVGLMLMAKVKLDVVVMAPGRLVAQAPTILVQPLETAVLRGLMVRPGQVVEAGALIATLDPTMAEADAAGLRTRARELDAEIARLAAEQEGKPYAPPTPSGGTLAEGAPEALQLAIATHRRAELAARLAAFDQRIQAARARIDSGERDTAHYRARLSVSSEIEGMRVDLQAKAVGSRLNALIAKDARTEIARNLAQSEQQIRTAGFELEAARAERDAHLQQWRAQIAQDLSARRTERGAIQRELSKADRRRELVELRAPQEASVVTTANIAVGAVAKSGDTLATLVPTDSPLEVEATVRGADQGFIKTGDPVRLKLSAFRFTVHGTMAGIVRSVSEDSFTTLDNGQPSPERFFRVRITVTDATLRDVPANTRLVAGMPLEADIVVGRRTILMYVAETALRFTAEGLREPT